MISDISIADVSSTPKPDLFQAFFGEDLYVDTGPVNFSDFSKTVIIPTVLKFLDTPLMNFRDLLQCINSVREIFDRAAFYRKHLVADEGFHITGASMWIDAMRPDQLQIAWESKSNFDNKFRHGVQDDLSLIGLGYWEEYDLYLGLRESLYPLLIIRHGSQRDEYISINPRYADMSSLIEDSSYEFSRPIKVAYDRAVFLNREDIFTHWLSFT